MSKENKRSLEARVKRLESELQKAESERNQLAVQLGNLIEGHNKLCSQIQEWIHQSENGPSDPQILLP